MSKRGWHKESINHRLANKGVKTKGRWIQKPYKTRSQRELEILEGEDEDYCYYSPSIERDRKIELQIKREKKEEKRKKEEELRKEKELQHFIEMEYYLKNKNKTSKPIITDKKLELEDFL